PPPPPTAGRADRSVAPTPHPAPAARHPPPSCLRGRVGLHGPRVPPPALSPQPGPGPCDRCPDRSPDVDAREGPGGGPGQWSCSWCHRLAAGVVNGLLVGKVRGREPAAHRGRVHAEVAGDALVRPPLPAQSGGDFTPI